MDLFARSRVKGFNMNPSTVSGSSEIQWCFSQVKGTLDDDVTEGKTSKTHFYFKWFHFQSDIFNLMFRNVQIV